LAYDAPAHGMESSSLRRAVYAMFDAGRELPEHLADPLLMAARKK
jgi:hypothetical protein